MERCNPKKCIVCKDKQELFHNSHDGDSKLQQNVAQTEK